MADPSNADTAPLTTRPPSVERPATAVRPIPAPAVKVLREQTREAHFWIFISVLVSHAILRSHILPESKWLVLAGYLMPALEAIAYQLGVFWQPPRTSWTENDRLANAIAYAEERGFKVEGRSDGK